jgi:hypothetical protein
MPYFCDKSYMKMKDEKAKRVCSIFYKIFSHDISLIISKYITDISVEEYKFYFKTSPPNLNIK